MTESNLTAAELLELSAAGYAAMAAAAFLETDTTVTERYGAGALASWRANYVQRLLELAAALRMGSPAAFTSRVVWQHNAFLARGREVSDLRAALACLRATLVAELPDVAGQPAAEYVDKALSALDAGVSLEECELDPSDPAGALALKYIAACLEGNPRRAIELVMDASSGSESLESIYLDVIFPVMREIGRMWHGAEASISEERIVSETTRRLMTLLAHACKRVDDSGRTVVSAAVAGNAHDMGVRAVADFFDTAGWRSLCLGADVPANDVAGAAQFFGADLVVLATTLTTQIKSLQATIAALRASSGEGVSILVGGLALADAPDLWQRLGADGYAGAGEAVEIGRELVGV